MNSLAGNSPKTTKAKTAPGTPTKPATAPSTPSKKRKPTTERDTPSVKKTKIKPVKPKLDYDGEEEEDEDEQELTTPAGLQGQLNVQSKLQHETYGSDDAFSFFDHAAYQQDQI